LWIKVEWISLGKYRFSNISLALFSKCVNFKPVLGGTAGHCGNRRGGLHFLPSPNYPFMLN
jgi:hypothetical protein